MVQQENGELQEDVVEHPLATGSWLDAEIDGSFPASDPLSHWAGPRRLESETDRAHGRIVRRRPVGDVPERRRPETPLADTPEQ